MAENIITRYTTIIILMAFISFVTVNAQIKWKRSAPKKLDLQLFHSLDMFNLPTAETMKKGDYHFGIHHRFVLPVSSGGADLWGIDGRVIMRIELGYALTNRLIATLGRSNRDGNYDFQARYKAIQIRHDVLPTLITFNAGFAYNSKPEPKPLIKTVEDSRKFQYFGHVIINTLIEKKLGLGFAPAFLYNSHINCPDVEYSITAGVYAQYYINNLMSVMLEYNPTVSGWRDKYDSFAIAYVLETGGHFFKIGVGNNILLNQSQYLAGAGDTFGSGDWHIGFNITRTL